MRCARRLAAVSAAVLLTGCGGDGSPAGDEDVGAAGSSAYSDECGEAVAAAGTTGGDEALDVAIATCGGLNELMAAVGDHPDAFTGDDLEDLVEDRCERSELEGIAGSVVCEQVGDPPLHDGGEVDPSGEIDEGEGDEGDDG